MAHPDSWLIHQARSAATGARIHAVEQLIGAYRCYAAVLARRPASDTAQNDFYRTEAMLRAGLRKAAA